MKIKRLGTALFIAALILVTYSPARAGVLMQGYFRDAKAQGKSWWDNLSEEAHEMRSAGFTAVWIPPVLKGASGGFSTGFDPFDDYDIGSKDEKGTVGTHWGTREELQRTVAIMRANGLDVYVWQFVSGCLPPRPSTTQFPSTTDNQCSVRWGLSPHCWCALSGARRRSVIALLLLPAQSWAKRDALSAIWDGWT